MNEERIRPKLQYFLTCAKPPTFWDGTPFDKVLGPEQGLLNDRCANFLEVINFISSDVFPTKPIRVWFITGWVSDQAPCQFRFQVATTEEGRPQTRKIIQDTVLRVTDSRRVEVYVFPETITLYAPVVLKIEILVDGFPEETYRFEVEAE